MDAYLNQLVANDLAGDDRLDGASGGIALLLDQFVWALLADDGLEKRVYNEEQDLLLGKHFWSTYLGLATVEGRLLELDAVLECDLGRLQSRVDLDVPLIAILGNDDSWLHGSTSLAQDEADA